MLNINARLSRVEDIIGRLAGKSADDIDKEKAFLEGLKSKILSGDNVILAEDVEETLVNIADALNLKPKGEVSNGCCDDTFGDLLSKLPENAKVISVKQCCVSSLQKFLEFDEKDNVLFGVCIITKNATINDAYRRIFPHSSLDSILDTIEVLLAAYYRHQKEMVLQ